MYASVRECLISAEEERQINIEIGISIATYADGNISYDELLDKVPPHKRFANAKLADLGVEHILYKGLPIINRAFLSEGEA